MGMESWVDGILHHRTEMRPLETHVEPRLQQLPGMKAVVFDIYGTLVISGSGDVGSADTVGRDSLIRQMLRESGLLGKLVSVPNADSLQQKIQQLNRERCNRCRFEIEASSVSWGGNDSNRRMESSWHSIANESR